MRKRDLGAAFLAFIFSAILGLSTRAAAPATAPSESGVQFKLTDKKFDAAKMFGKQAILLMFDASAEVGNLSGTILVKDRDGVLRGKVTVSQSVEFKSFAVRINYDPSDEFLKWLKDAPIKDLNVKLYADHSSGPPAEVNAKTNAPDANPQAPATPPAASLAPPSPTQKEKPKVIFLVDGSGSMQTKYAEARNEVLKAVRDLPDGQQFDIFIDVDSNPLSLSKTYVVASKKNRESAYKMIEDFSPRGQGAMGKTLGEAFKLHPVVIWLISDGNILDWKPDSKEVAAVEQEAKVAGVKINTVLSFAGDTKNSQYLLAHFSQTTGGTCYNEDHKPITYDELNPTHKINADPQAPAPPEIPAGKSILSD